MMSLVQSDTQCVPSATGVPLSFKALCHGRVQGQRPFPKSSSPPPRRPHHGGHGEHKQHGVPNRLGPRPRPLPSPGPRGAHVLAMTGVSCDAQLQVSQGLAACATSLLGGDELRCVDGRAGRLQLRSCRGRLSQRDSGLGARGSGRASIRPSSARGAPRHPSPVSPTRVQNQAVRFPTARSRPSTLRHRIATASPARLPHPKNTAL